MVLSLLVGALLATCGALLQGLFRNPLADPALIGVSAGASVGASLVIVFGSMLTANGLLLGLSAISVGAFAGAIITSVIIFRLATGPQGTSVATMLLAGIAISALAGAATNTLSYLADNDMLRRISLWQMGNLQGASWDRVGLCALTCGILKPYLIPREAGALNAMLLGESEARHLGVNVEWLKRRLDYLLGTGGGDLGGRGRCDCLCWLDGAPSHTPFSRSKSSRSAAPVGSGWRHFVSRRRCLGAGGDCPG